MLLILSSTLRLRFVLQIGRVALFQVSKMPKNVVVAYLESSRLLIGTPQVIQ